MSDIEDELLALAGGDVSSDEEENGHRGRTSSRSPTPPAAAASNKETPAAKGVAINKTPTKKAKKTRSDDESIDDAQEDEFEEGEASAPGSPDSQQSVPMDESDSDSDAPQSKAPPGEEDEKKYPYEGLFTDAAEKSRILAMREIEREQILAERREIHERARQRQVLRQLMENRKEESKKRKLSVAELDDVQRKTSRVRTKVGGTKVGETSSGMDNLRRAREERSNQIRQRERENDRRKARSPEDRRSVDRNEGPDSEDDWQRPGKYKRKSESPGVRESAALVLRDFERVRMGRARFAEVCFYPGFEEAIRGCYVRLFLGPDPETREPKYRMCLIKGFTKGKPYAMTIDEKNGRQIVVDYYATLAYGKSQREMPFIWCSNDDFKEGEWRRYKDVCMADHVELPKKQTLVNKINDINRLSGRTWTELELVEKLERQNGLLMKFSQVPRENLEREIAKAQIAKNTDLAAKLQADLDNMETPRLAFRTSLVPTKKPGGISASQQEAVRMGEDIPNRLNGEDSAGRRPAKTRSSVPRRKRLRVEVAASRAMGKASSPAPGGAETSDTNATVLPHIAKAQELQRQSLKKGIPTIHRPLMDDDIIGALDLDIDVEI